MAASPGGGAATEKSVLRVDLSMSELPFVRRRGLSERMTTVVIPIQSVLSPGVSLGQGHARAQPGRHFVEFGRLTQPTSRNGYAAIGV